MVTPHLDTGSVFVAPILDEDVRIVGVTDNRSLMTPVFEEVSVVMCAVPDGVVLPEILHKGTILAFASVIYVHVHCRNARYHDRLRCIRQRVKSLLLKTPADYFVEGPAGLSTDFRGVRSLCGFELLE